jgi:hypothetical protein
LYTALYGRFKLQTDVVWKFRDLLGIPFDSKAAAVSPALLNLSENFRPGVQWSVLERNR